MTWIIVFCSVVGFGLAIAGLFVKEPLSMLFGGILMGAGFCLAICAPLFNSPTAMDVYQGKTTLEITYKDGVAIDSTVVFKDKK